MESVDKYSTITIREKKERKQVKITSSINPEIQSNAIKKWQSLLDTVAKIINVPSCLIMKLNEDSIEVYLKSNTEGNPYEVGEKSALNFGLYCENVIGTQEKLIVPNAKKSSIWKDNNPDVDINMISYLGYPINWPDGVVFGTICLLDNKENHYTKDFQDLLLQMKQNIETDLQILTTNKDLKDSNAKLNKLNNIKTRFLSLISHDIRGSISTTDVFLKLIIEEFNNYNSNELKHTLEALSQNISSTYLSLESLLSWSKSDLVQLEPNIAQVNIVDVLEELLHYFHQAVKIKNIKVRTAYYSNRAFIAADKDMITTSIRNILSNAVKYTPVGGKITVRVLLLNKRHFIEIEDTGTGMPQTVVDNLFSYDKSNREKKTGQESGSGIGLMLAKEFLDKNNATVEVESEIEKGTTFRIKI